MSGERTIPTRGRTDQAGTEIKVNGNTLPLSVPVHSVDIRKSFNKISAAKIMVIDGNPSEENAEWSSSDHFVPGNEIEILAGYEQNYQRLFKGIVVKQKLKIRKDATPMLVVDCRDKSYLLTLGRKNRYFADMTDADIIAEILDESSIDGELDSTQVTHQQMVQYRGTDWDFIVMRAEANGKVVLPDDGILKMISPDITASPEFSVIFGASLIEFDGELDARAQSGITEATGWDFTDQDKVSAENGSIDEASVGNQDTATLSGNAGFEKNDLRNTALRDSAELEEIASALQFKVANAKVRGRASFMGTEKAKPGAVVDMQGLGTRFSGAAFVWGVRHELAPGTWKTDVELGIDHQAFHEKYNIAEPAAGGLLPPVNGLEIGKVTAIEGDPDGEYRIKVKVPTINNEDEGNWARICTLDAGDSRGTFFRPEIDDEVLVGFINDDPRSPVVLGMLHSSALPAPSENTDDNHEKGLVTRSGMKLWFNDDLVTCVIETPNGNVITLSEDESKIHIEDVNGNIFDMSPDGIAMDSAADISITASGDVTIEGTNVDITANSKITASGSSGAEVSSSGTTDVKGSIVQIN